MQHIVPPSPAQRPSQCPAQSPAQCPAQCQAGASAADRHGGIDRAFHAALANATGGLSPMGLATAWFDWAAHLAGSPAKQAALQEDAISGAARMMQNAVGCALGTAPFAHAALSRDRRFADPEWQHWPFDLAARCFQLTEAWWDCATTGVQGVNPRHAQLTNFAARQLLDAVAPSNFALTNPVVLRRTQEERGANLMRGLHNYLEDLSLWAQGEKPDTGGFKVGETLAATPGEVVHRSPLMELIRYTPVTEKVHAEPLLIVPAWIMKYYILDLSERNSMVRYLTGQGFEVYMISWLNPGASEAEMGMEDYVRLGIFDALDAIGRAVPGERVHAAGYCLGGTLLSIAAAALARDGRQERLASLTLLAAQVDFTEAGEITLFIDDSQVAFLEDTMAQQGYLRSDQMAGAFQMLRSVDLIWSRTIHDYLLGERAPMIDLIAWNADTTRMPAKMHSEYLRHLFLENRLALGQFEIGGDPVALEDVHLPVFAIGTEKDHIAPWPSVWKVTRFFDGPITFALTSGGHNAGIVSEPGHKHRHYRIGEISLHAADREDWVAAQPVKQGSWWPEWTQWLAKRGSARKRTAGPCPLPSLGAAPGSYVFG
ncbi:PHA/PHB synthase family protein [Alloyangia pacifica]|uniref:PHA/PHB synthase family protein n=1 Tax=Alloyangia pacifica TaxID=311180 RepID=UPI001CD6DD54|nr:alpha/beta fold hydrolase [Alloyangia pacifica]MCA0995155.1 alpha/beta fold hydrolase [Alloyangia pacifica]